MDLRFLVLLLCLGSIHAKLMRLSCAQIRALVDQHNGVRLRVARGQVPRQPPAAAMSSVIWDEELAAKAAKWAANNKFAHNPDRTTVSKRFKTGENIYMFGTTDKTHVFDPAAAVDNWFQEHAQYSYKKMDLSDFTSSQEIGHYTQMIWSSTVRIGCGVSNFQRGRFTKWLVVCNYGPAGNIIGQYPYPKGKGVNQLTCGAGDCTRMYGSC